MRTIAHLSDLHFNAVDRHLIPSLTEAIQAANPDIVAVSGDLTQHALEDEFRSAMEFLQTLPGRLIIVPGNHDMSFYNVWRRATQRLKLFHSLVTPNREPFYRDDEISVLGVNTARISHLRNGRIRSWQVRRLEERMAGAGPEAIRVLVTHHPFDLPEHFPDRELVARGREYLPRVVKCVDLLLAGHMHITHSGPTALRFKTGGESAVFVQAGTALSTRTRTERNGFQIIRTQAGAIETCHWVANGYKFTEGERRVFRRQQGAWMPEQA